MLFDLDGTLLDNAVIVVDAYYTGIQHLGYNATREQIAKQAGKSTFDTGRALGLHGDDLKQLDQWFWKYFSNYCENITDEINVINGVKAVLQYNQNHRIRMGVVTSNSATNAKALLNKAQLDQYFEVIIGKENTSKLKPDPAPINLALSKMEHTNEPVWFVGDTASDIESARATGITSIGIPQPHSRHAVVAAEPDVLMNNMEELLHLLKDLTETTIRG